eukprot:CAMPEP_0184443946 /NCGR_PEP_ID=MMETSP0740-20130409/926_1 /TAXON_ID=385413 /ORGANISM="Thalassiosira miniscula, Strain CCMP1093" /LENGTH=214 /DNA_ID=CAMNT_0026812481 /DNA_START=241 /DNA_END=882 /DNA_ORIENTATION=-
MSPLPNSALNRFHDLLGTVGQVVGGDHIKTGGVDDLFAGFHVGALKAHNQRNLQANLFHSGHNALCDYVTAHDAAEDVHKDAFDLWVRRDDFERFSHFLFGGAATHVEEVRRLSTVEFDDVHGGHRETRAVHHAADFTVQSDVVEVILGRLKLFGVFFGFIAQFYDVGVAVEGVAVKANFGVEHFQCAAWHDDQRVDLQLLHVFFHEGFVENAH